ncbi:hypothetical protein THASP1DRAFT_21374 [Thamnocephalis sphaerospora]|uniref:DUF4349 domain-containing protein n=1 Tax=Thamnocephalis sphaerospora TaxID=78915 RepID=A0A4P9XY15_9FUNG|nr:hypothetical protein THASP1DRAFT_21374 [Thamnocephalis sphaerospora]|eukprot:RKP10982.1 hypothetical protein THASP1DRAFT_21374 [Thamnocephalis sphaerospora]
MRWYRILNALALSAVVISAATAVLATPITDESSTSLSVSPTTVTPYGDQEFSVTVERIDDLRDDYGGLIAKRVMDVKLNFAVDDDKVLVNGVPVDFGISTVDVQSAVMLGYSGIVAGLTAEEVSPAFDQGLVRVKVKARADKLLLDASELADQDVDESTKSDALAAASDNGLLEVRRIVVAARIIEINGLEVVQSDVVEQVIDILPTGGVHRGQPKAVPMIAGLPGIMYSDAFDAEELAEDAQKMPCHRGAHHHIAQQAAKAWNNLSPSARLGITIFGITFLVLTLFVALPFAMYAQWRARRDPAYRALMGEDTEEGMDFYADEKKTGGLTDPQLLHTESADPPAYEESKLLPRSSTDEERAA